MSTSEDAKTSTRKHWCKEHRLVAGLTAQEFADQIPVYWRTLREWISSGNIPKGRVERFAELLQVSVEDLREHFAISHRPPQRIVPEKIPPAEINGVTRLRRMPDLTPLLRILLDTGLPITLYDIEEVGRHKFNIPHLSRLE